MEARVVSHSSVIVQLDPVGSNEMVKFSCGAGSLDNLMSARVKSDLSPG